MRSFRLLLSVLVVIATGVVLPQAQARAVPIACLVCGSTPLAAPGVDGTVSYAVISGAAFAAEVAAHGIGFFGAVPSGTLGPPVLPAPGDFVYLYQLVNDGPSLDFITTWDISGGVVGPAGITAGTRLESTLFVEPGVGLVSDGPAGALPGLVGSGFIDFENGLGPPLPTNPVPPWGPCLGSGPSGVWCSDGTADLLATSVLVYDWLETPSGVLLDPSWSGSVIWFASPFAPGAGATTITDGAFIAGGAVPVPVPEPSTAALLGLGLLGVTLRRRC